MNVETAAHSAEMPWPGVQSMFVAKAGGNTYHGSWYSDYENKKWQSFNVDDSQKQRGAQGSPRGVTPVLGPGDLNRMTKYHDLNADVGGFISRDRLWWYGSFRNRNVAAQYANFPVEPHVTDLLNYSGKGTYQVSKNNKVVAFATAKLSPFKLRSGSTPGMGRGYPDARILSRSVVSPAITQLSRGSDQSRLTPIAASRLPGNQRTPSA